MLFAAAAAAIVSPAPPRLSVPRTQPHQSHSRGDEVCCRQQHTAHRPDPARAFVRACVRAPLLPPAAEYTKRGESFYKEADFVFANTLMAIIADFMLTWLPAPTLSYR